MDPLRHCIHHTDRPAVGLCHQCHKPICVDCCYDVPTDDVFCSRECYDRYLAYHSRKPPAIRRSGLKSLAVGCLILLVAGVGLAIVAQRVLGLPVLDWIRKLF